MDLVFLGDLNLNTDKDLVISEDLLNLLNKSDFVSVNLEGPIISEASNPFPKVGPYLSQTISVKDFLKTINCSHLNLANNHIMDYGDEGLQNTLSELDYLSFSGAGFTFEEAYRPAIFHKNDMKIALFSFAEAQFGVLKEDIKKSGFAWIGHPLAKRAINSASKKFDYVIVQIHAGLEMYELPLPEWRLAFKEIVNNGADLVIGHHPHLIQGTETYNSSDIFYSLGDFYIEDSNFNECSGGILKVSLENNKLESYFYSLKLEQDTIGISTLEYSKNLLNSKSFLFNDDEQYLKEIEEICCKEWNENFLDYYSSSMSGLGTFFNFKNLKKLFYRLIRFLISPREIKRKNELLLLHNIGIETNRFVVERALNISNKLDN